MVSDGIKGDCNQIKWCERCNYIGNAMISGKSKFLFPLGGGWTCFFFPSSVAFFVIRIRLVNFIILLEKCRLSKIYFS